MKMYLVGGAVRDSLLGMPVRDRDWVVVGSTPQAMLGLGFLPVGKDFPVFLHPTTKEEYALARTERKITSGYQGFTFHAAPEVTLEEDLARRDLTINAIAVLAKTTEHPLRFEPDFASCIDPFNGKSDLHNKVMRHVSSAFTEDPVRILRLARFAARFPDFDIAEQTMNLMRAMVRSGEVDALVPERVWQELSRGMMESKPSRMFEVLRECAALCALLPEINQLWGTPQPAEYYPEVDAGTHAMMVMDMAAQLGCTLSARFACLCRDVGRDVPSAHEIPNRLVYADQAAKLRTRICERLRVPVVCRGLADLVAREQGCIHRSLHYSATALVFLFERCDAFRKPARFDDALLACEADARGRKDMQSSTYPQRAHLLQTLRIASSIATRSIAESTSQTLGTAEPVGLRIAKAIHAARVAAIEDFLKSSPIAV